MWLLSTARAELHFFSDPSDVPGGFAILSHTWSPKGELSFQELQEICSNCQRTGENPRDRVHEKIRKCCEVAERDGYSWVWIDTCCINKESSTELSEAINSMFSWYVLSEVCYVYLADVHKDDNPHASDSEFRRSRWHTRGWTLQELLGPALLIFMSREWERIGTKYELCQPLGERTAIPGEYLTRKYLIFNASIAERMLWASKRETTRIEDEAYCLLGLLDISMPILYGERRQAFQRLQLELAKKQYVDTTLFVWGLRHYEEHNNLSAVPLSRIWLGFYGASHKQRFLFATSPSDYVGPSTYLTTKLAPNSVLQPYVFSQWTKDLEESAKYIGKNLKNTGPFGSIELPSCEVTGYGFKCRFPVAEVDGFTIAVLLAQTNNSHLGLILHQAPESELQDPTRRMYYVGWPFEKGNAFFSPRLVDLGSDLYHLSFRGKPVNAVWRDIYIHATPRTIDNVDPLHLVLKLLSDRAPGRFRFPRQLIQTMIKLGFLPSSGIASSSDPNASENVWVNFTEAIRGEGIRIHLGLCKKDSEDGAPVHWAFTELSDISNWNDQWKKTAHDCQNDHLSDWKDGGHTFGDEKRRIRLTLVKCPHSPDMRVVRMELSGSVYNAIQRQAGITIGEHKNMQRKPVDSGRSLTTRAGTRDTSILTRALVVGTVPLIVGAVLSTGAVIVFLSKRVFR